MHIENQEFIYCPEDGEFRVYCNICDLLCIERYYKNHLKSQTSQYTLNSLPFSQ